jgi:hypothetical protein
MGYCRCAVRISLKKNRFAIIKQQQRYLGYMTGEPSPASLQ